MAIATHARIPSAMVDEMIGLLSRTTDRREIVWITDQLGASGDRRAIRPLLLCLGACQGRENADAEASVCEALMRLDVMCRCGQCSYTLRPRAKLPDDVVETIRDVAREIPWPYFGTRRA